MSNKAKILLVDDEARILRSLSMLLRFKFEVFATSSPIEALSILSQHKIAVVVSDQRMPVMTGSVLLSKAKVLAPRAIRILLTGYADTDSALEALNEGEIFKYATKPWDNAALTEILQEAVNMYNNGEQDTAQVAPPLFVKQNAAPTLDRDPTKLDDLPKRLNCLILDSDINTMRTVRDIVDDTVELIWCKNIHAAKEAIASKKVHIFITELSVEQHDVTQLIYAMQKIQPDTLTVVMTSFKDTGKLVGLINGARIYRCFPKPIPKNLLARSIRSGIERISQM